MPLPDMPIARFFRRKPITGLEARQGFLDRPVLAILVVSLVLVCAAFGLMLLTILG
jgi:hypothetical protein